MMCVCSVAATSAINEAADNGYKSTATAGSTDRDGKEKKHGWEQKKKQSEGQNKKQKTSHGDQESLRDWDPARVMARWALEGKCVCVVCVCPTR